MTFLQFRAAFLSGLLSVWACHSVLCLAADSNPGPDSPSISPENPGGIQKAIESAIRAGRSVAGGARFSFALPQKFAAPVLETEE